MLSANKIELTIKFGNVHQKSNIVFEIEGREECEKFVNAMSDRLTRFLEDNGVGFNKMVESCDMPNFIEIIWS